MIVAVGSDHAGFPLKIHAMQEIEALGHKVLDCGTFDENPCDYPDFARKVGEALIGGKAERGIILCGSGVGASVAASKIPGVRAAVCHDLYSAAQGVEHDNMNVLCLGARVIDAKLARKLVQKFLGAQFQSREERFVRRLGKVQKIERDALSGVFDRKSVGSQS